MRLLTLLLIWVMAAVGVGVGGAPVSSPAYANPFAYCAAVGTIDAPDARWTGPAVPEVIARGLQKAFGAPPDAPLEPFLRNSHWRCMDGKVYACNVGANIPCLEKADLSRTPSAPMTAYCKANPGADVIPAYVTGRATVYTWRCEGSTAVIERQVNQPDGRGFLARYWYEIPSPAL